MDQTWRDTHQNVLEREDMTRWEKFKEGGYSFKNMMGFYLQNIDEKKAKADYILSLFENVKEIENDEDKMLVRKVQAKVLYQYNLYKIPTAGVFLIYALSTALNTKYKLLSRGTKSLFLASVGLGSCHYCGNYGIQKQLDLYFEILLSDYHLKRGSAISLDAQNFLQSLAVLKK